MKFEKNKILIFSYDDGVTQDERLIGIMNKYGIKGTFNINSKRLGSHDELVREGVTVLHHKFNPEDVRRIYSGHEIAGHTLTHPRLPDMPSDEDVIRQVEEDRRNLSELAGYEVTSFAYPCGGVNNDGRVADIIKKNTGIKYARTITSTHAFSAQDELFRFNPSVYYIEENLEEIIDSFLALKTDEPALLYIWGHSYEMDYGADDWVRLEEFFQLISNRKDIFYGTNREVLL